MSLEWKKQQQLFVAKLLIIRYTLGRNSSLAELFNPVDKLIRSKLKVDFSRINDLLWESMVNNEIFDNLEVFSEASWELRIATMNQMVKVIFKEVKNIKLFVNNAEEICKKLLFYFQENAKPGSHKIIVACYLFGVKQLIDLLPSAKLQQNYSKDTASHR